MTIDNAWLDARITRAKELIVIYEDAIEAVGTIGQSYTLDTGQSRQTVTKGDIGSMRLMLQAQENRLSTLCARRFGAGHVGRMFE